PASIEDATRRIQNLTSEIDSLEREQVTGATHDDRLQDLKAKRTQTESELAELNAQWTKEKDLTDQIRNIRTKLEMTRLDAKLGGKNGKGSTNGDGASGVVTQTTAGEAAPAETAAAATMSAGAETAVEETTG